MWVRRLWFSALLIVKYDLLVQHAVGAIQLCAGQDAGCEAAVHAMKQVFADENTEAIILIDAFNCLNRQVTLLNCGTVCPALCLYYRKKALFGDPLAMALYAIWNPASDPTVGWHC